MKRIEKRVKLSSEMTFAKKVAHALDRANVLLDYGVLRSAASWLVDAQRLIRRLSVGALFERCCAEWLAAVVRLAHASNRRREVEEMTERRRRGSPANPASVGDPRYQQGAVHA